jgi:hypothetical protein
MVVIDSAVNLTHADSQYQAETDETPLVMIPSFGVPFEPKEISSADKTPLTHDFVEKETLDCIIAWRTFYNNKLTAKEMEVLIKELKQFLAEEIDEMKNPYPKDIFRWDNKEKLKFNHGRFNRHCYEIYEFAKEDLKKKLLGGKDV